MVNIYLERPMTLRLQGWSMHVWFILLYPYTYIFSVNLYTSAHATGYTRMLEITRESSRVKYLVGAYTRMHAILGACTRRRETERANERERERRHPSANHEYRRFSLSFSFFLSMASTHRAKSTISTISSALLLFWLLYTWVSELCAAKSRTSSFLLFSHLPFSLTHTHTPFLSHLHPARYRNENLAPRIHFAHFSDAHCDNTRAYCMGHSIRLVVQQFGKKLKNHFNLQIMTQKEMNFW